jgi:hypothetical protein
MRRAAAKRDAKQAAVSAGGPTSAVAVAIEVATVAIEAVRRAGLGPIGDRVTRPVVGVPVARDTLGVG